MEIRGWVENIQTTALLKSARILRRVLETWGDPSERPSANADVKNSQEVNSNNNNNNLSHSSEVLFLYFIHCLVLWRVIYIYIYIYIYIWYFEKKKISKSHNQLSSSSLFCQQFGEAFPYSFPVFLDAFFFLPFGIQIGNISSIVRMNWFNYIHCN